MADSPTPSFEPRKAEKSGASLGKMFIVVFVAAVVGSYVGGAFSGFSTTGQLFNINNIQNLQNQNAAQAAAQGGSPSPSNAPEPAGPTVRMADILDNDPVRGDANAPVTIVEFSDYQCPFCERFYTQSEKQILQDYVAKGKVKIVYRDYPLPFHPEAEPTALAADCANEQGKFWEFHDRIFENQASLSEQFRTQTAQQIGLDMTKYNDCVSTKKYLSEVQKDLADGSQLSVSGTPSFYIGKSGGTGQLVVGAQPFPVFKAKIDAELA